MIYEILGEPVPWKAHKGFGKRSYSPNHDRKNTIKWDLMSQREGMALIDKPVKLTLRFEMAIPKSAPIKFRKRVEDGERIYHTTRPDCTNLQKMIEDCLTGTVITDDNIVVYIQSVKYYSLIPRTLIHIEEI